MKIYGKGNAIIPIDSILKQHYIFVQQIFYNSQSQSLGTATVFTWKSQFLQKMSSSRIWNINLSGKNKVVIQALLASNMMFNGDEI